jgi:O-antigen ligase
MQRSLAALTLAAVMIGFYNSAVDRAWLALGLAAYAALLWRIPLAWLVVLPLAVPIVDTMPWTGRLHFGSFDLIVGLSVAAGLWRAGQIRLSDTAVVGKLYAGLLIVVVLASMVGWLGAKDLGIGDYTHYFGGANAWRESKGWLAGMALFALACHEARRNKPVAELFSLGMLGGLAVVCLVVIWERLLFTGPFDFSQAYRVTGLFSSMHIGGAAIDGYLALTLPFILSAFLLTSHPLLRFLVLSLLGFALYAFLVTFSRTNYLALSTMIGLGLAGGWMLKHAGAFSRRRNWWPWLAGTAIAVFVAAPIVSGSYLQSRMATLPQDLETRLEHWADSLAAMNAGPSQVIFGRGLGSYPRQYRTLEQSRGEHSAEVYLLQEAGEPFARFTSSDHRGDLFLRQRLRLTGDKQATLELKLRSHGETPDKLLVEFCEMNVLRPKPECHWVGVTMNAAPRGQWATYGRPVGLGQYGESLLGLSRPVEILLLNRGLRGAVDIASVRLTGASGESLLENPDFDEGMDNWYFNSGDHLKWHAKNLFLQVYFETGLIGLVLLASLLLLTASRLLERLADGDRFALVLLVSLAGFLVVGIFDSLIDDPRLLMLLLVLLGVSLSPARLALRAEDQSLLPWRPALAVLTVMVAGLAVVTVAHTSLTRKIPPRQLVSLALERADIDWPWLKQALKPPSLPSFPGPQEWPLHGASQEPLSSQRYDDRGAPLPPVNEGSALSFFHQNTTRVSDPKALISALKGAAAGDRIVLAPGQYRIGGKSISLGGPGTPLAPIIVTTDRPGEARILLDTVEGFYVDQPYWVFENLEIRGNCRSHSRCEHAFHVVGRADGTVIRNNRMINFNAAVKVNGLPGPGGEIMAPHHGLIARNSIYNESPRRTGNPVTLLNINNGDSWVVRGNFIADFYKQGSDRISYAAFMKGNSRDGVFEENLVVCHWRLPNDAGIRVGLSLGGGGTGDRFCRDQTCEVEHTGGIIRNNIIARCPSDVGIYLNRARDTLVHNNLLAETRGIDVRFETSSALLVNNILQGGIDERDGGTAVARNNLLAPTCNPLFRWFADCTLEDWYAHPAGGDYRLRAVETIIGTGESVNGGDRDFCGARRQNPPDMGPIQYVAGATCLPR